ncbi:L-asparaginase [Wenyingzhuangia heitensis]|uniref:L-asparaginase n=1 Tax=Wenyingzhuangia heitensis TaxID=1487859 RepID=A0ABX0U8G3_9FLAO|nr:asparaginase domain-containing protein [Wenyingzhuangia heitensis]NIJ44478.1 L-asparaginase [Wenyingzhuangia heitensis]
MKILLIYTGGTIGMIKDKKNQSLVPNGVKPIEEFLIEEDLLHGISIKSTKQVIDSSNFGLKYFNELAVIVEQEYYNYDAFLVLMGTDTMAYVSSLLSYSIQGLNKSIVFTGGQLPLFDNKSDSKTNLKNSLLALKENRFPKEVGIYFHHKWHRAVCTTKIDSEGYDAYISPNFKSIEGIKTKKKFKVYKKIEANIVVIKLIPFGNDAILKLVLESNSFDGVVLEVFGSGNMPEFSKEIRGVFKEKISKGLKIVLVSQCLKGGITIGRYAASIQAKELEFVSAGSMTVEATVAKMLFLHDKKLNIQEYRRFFEESVRGET